MSIARVFRPAVWVRCAPLGGIWLFARLNSDSPKAAVSILPIGFARTTILTSAASRWRSPAWSQRQHETTRPAANRGPVGIQTAETILPAVSVIVVLMFRVPLRTRLIVRLV